MTDNIELHQENIWRFIDISTRCSFKYFKENISKTNPFSPLLAPFVNNARLYFEQFKRELVIQLSKAINPAPIGIDLRSRFYLMIDRYTNWYSKNIENINSLGRNNVFELMLNIIGDTKAEIEKYFPENTLSEKIFPINIKQQKEDLQQIFSDEEKRYAKDKKRIVAKLNTILEPENKIAFLKNELRVFYEGLQPVTTASSGVIQQFPTFQNKKLFLDRFIETEIQKIENGVNSSPVQKPEHSLREVALFLFYNGEKVDKKNADQLAKKYNHKSGQKLYQLFTFYSSNSNRIQPEETKKKAANKIALLNRVITMLNGAPQAKAKDELKTMTAKNKEYSP
ncbi:MAG: hypothetical protein FD123_2751 [Bacteroidetes bacterium]|nr:MAG: hypothetical protein FD123_2751 [Bacteroidota bacterium]